MLRDKEGQESLPAWSVSRAGVDTALWHSVVGVETHRRHPLPLLSAEEAFKAEEAERGKTVMAGPV